MRLLSASTKVRSIGQVRLLRFAYLAAIAVSILAVMQIFRLETPYRAWIFVATCTVAVLLFAWIGRGFRHLYEPLLRQRQQELTAMLVRGAMLRVRGTPGVFVPLILCLIALTLTLPAGIATTLMGRSLLVVGIAVLAVFWYWAVPRLRAPILELDRNGLRTKQLGRIPWADVERAQLLVNGSVDNDFISGHVLQLEFVLDRHPRPSHGWRRWLEAFFRGMSEWEARIPLRNPSENPLVILNLVVFFIRNTPRYQEQRSARQPPQTLENFQPHDLPGLPLSRAAEIAKTAIPLARAAVRPTPPGGARRIVRQQFIPHSVARRWSEGRVISALFLVFVLCAFGFRVDFVGSEAWKRASTFICLAVIALPCWHLGIAIMRGTVNNPEITTPFMRALFAWIFGPVLVYALCWSILAVAMPDIFTRLAGTRFKEIHSLRKEYSHQRRGCDYRVTGPPFESGSLKNHYCSWAAEYDRLPTSGPMVVRGRKTWLGRHIDSVEPLDPLLSR